MAWSPHSSPAAGGITSAHRHPRTQAGTSLEQATGLSTLLPEVNLNSWGSVQLLFGWKKEEFVTKAEASTGEVWKAVSPPYPMLLLTPALSLCPSSTGKILIKFSSKLVFSSSSFLMSNQGTLVAES